MNMKLSLSVEETNRLRAKVGLKLIPVKNTSECEKNDDNGTLQISIEETNRLRKQVGLKPIPTDPLNDIESENYSAYEKQKRQIDDIDRLRAELNKKKMDLKNKQRMEKGGILDRIENNASAKDSGVLDFDSWLEVVGKEIKNDKVKKLSFKKKDKAFKKNLDEEIKEGIVISHDKASFSEKVKMEKEVVLTSKDINVLDDDNFRSDENEKFENRQLQREELLKKTLNERKGARNLVNLENDNNPSDVGGFVLADAEQDTTSQIDSKKRKLVSLKIESSDDESSDGGTAISYDENGVEAKKISKFMKRDVSKFKKSKKKVSGDQVRRRTFDKELVEKTFTPVQLELDEDYNEGGSELERILNVGRQNTFKSRRVIMEPINNTGGESHGEVIDETVEFLSNIQTEDVVAESNKNTKAKSNNANEKDSAENNTSSRYRAILESENGDNYHTYGVSNVLNALKSGSKSLNGKNENGDVEIVYTDDSGKVLNTKEAFKYLSHKFHGSKKK